MSESTEVRPWSAEQIVEQWLTGPSGDEDIDDDGGCLRDFMEYATDARQDLERRIREVLATMIAEAQVERMKHDLSWHYDEVRFLRAEMQKALNTILRPPALDWPGDEHPITEASRILSGALSPARRHQ